MFRHTFVSLLMSNPDIGVATVAAEAGHAQPSTTLMIYTCLLYTSNNKLVDAEGHLTDEGLYAIKDGTLDDLGALEAAEHLSFCDYGLLRYTAMIDAAPDCMKQPMRDLIPVSYTHLVLVTVLSR